MRAVCLGAGGHRGRIHCQTGGSRAANPEKRTVRVSYHADRRRSPHYSHPQRSRYDESCGESGLSRPRGPLSRPFGPRLWWPKTAKTRPRRIWDPGGTGEQTDGSHGVLCTPTGACTTIYAVRAVCLGPGGQEVRTDGRGLAYVGAAEWRKVGPSVKEGEQKGTSVDRITRGPPIRSIVHPIRHSLARESKSAGALSQERWYGGRHTWAACRLIANVVT